MIGPATAGDSQDGGGLYLYPPLEASIHVAAAEGDIEAIRRHLDDGVAVDVPTQSPPRWVIGATPLMWAAARGQVEAVRFLIGAEANVDAQSERGLTPLMVASGAMPTIGGKLLPSARLLIEAGADLEAIDQQGRTAIFHACGDGSPLEHPRHELLPEEFRIPTQSIYIRPGRGGRRPVVYLAPQRVVAARKGDAERLAALIEAGADINATDEQGRTVLMRAAISSDPARVQQLLEAGAEVRWRDVHAAGRGGNGKMLELLLVAARQTGGIDDDDRARLMVTAAGSQEDSDDKVRVLLEGGFDVNSTWRGRTALLASLSRGGQGAASLRLLEAGADASVRDRHGDTTLLLCAQYGTASALADLLGRAGFDISERSQTENHSTVLVLAAQSSRDARAKVELLLAAGTDIEAATEDDITPILAASMEGNMDTVVALAEAGARVNVADPGPVKDARGATHRYGSTGMTPLMYVANRGADSSFQCEATGEDAIRALLDHGARIDAVTPAGETALAFAQACDHPGAVEILLEASADRRKTSVLHGK
ncbi:MAG: ankyrin repeat domain-containing protein [Gammaproteobacteria bacterium]